MVDGWRDNKKGVGETGGIWWKDKEETLVNNMNIDGSDICKYGNNCGAWKNENRNGIYVLVKWVELG